MKKRTATIVKKRLSDAVMELPIEAQASLFEKLLFSLADEGYIEVQNGEG